MEREATPQPQERPLGERLEDAAQAVREEVSDRAYQGGERIRDHTAHSVEDVADAVKQSAERLQDQGAGVAPYLKSAAEQLAIFADRMRHKSIQETIADLETMARRNPMVFFAASALVGFGLTRLARSTRDTTSVNKNKI